MPLGNKIARGQLTALIQTLAIRHQVNLRTAGRTYAVTLPLDNTFAEGNMIWVNGNRSEMTQGRNYLDFFIIVKDVSL